MDKRITTCTAFAGHRLLAAGTPGEVVPLVRAATGTGTEPILLFDDRTGAVIDLDLRGTAEDILARLSPDGDAPQTPRGRGRPRLGVVAREVTLLPRHWDWLAAQPGGASNSLRRLVDRARREDAGETETRQARERGYRFLSALAGDLPGFEAASRALFAGDIPRFAASMESWPTDIRDHALALSRAPTP